MASTYRFELAATVHGPRKIESIGGTLGLARVAAIARRDFGPTCSSAEAWCGRWSEQLGASPDAVSIDVYEVSADGKARFTLYYMPWSDSGTLFLDGSARMAKLALWPDGFRPAGVEADALSQAFAAAIAARLKSAKKKRQPRKR